MDNKYVLSDDAWNLYWNLEYSAKMNRQTATAMSQLTFDNLKPPQKAMKICIYSRRTFWLCSHRDIRPLLYFDVHEMNCWKKSSDLSFWLICLSYCLSHFCMLLTLVYPSINPLHKGKLTFLPPLLFHLFLFAFIQRKMLVSLSINPLSQDKTIFLHYLSPVFACFYPT